MSWLRTRMQPWEGRPGISWGSSVPWMPITPAPWPVAQARVAAGPERPRAVESARVLHPQLLADPEVARRGGGARPSDPDRGAPYPPAGAVEGGAQSPAIHHQARPDAVWSAQCGVPDPSRPRVRAHRDADPQPGAPVAIGEPPQDRVDLREPILGEVVDAGDAPRAMRRQPPDGGPLLGVGPVGERAPIRETHAAGRLDTGAHRCWCPA